MVVAIAIAIAKMFRFICLIIFIGATFASNDSFTEELFIKPLSSGHIYSMFQFTTMMNTNIFDEKIPSHFHLFPRSFAEIISTFNIAELHLTLTQGQWRYNKWGYSIENAPTGIALWILFHPDLNQTQVEKSWEGVVHALSGQFCSSLNFISKEFTGKPILSFKPSGLWDSEKNPNDYLRYATLSRESVCTENLTPWKRLLPCGDHAGFASLLEASSLFDSSYVSISVHLRSTCNDELCQNIQLELQQSISQVHDGRQGKVKNSLQGLFNKQLKSRCPISSHSNIIMDLTDPSIKYSSISVTMNEITHNEENKQNKYLYDLTSTNISFPFNIDFMLESDAKDALTAPYIQLHKYTTGYGVEMGGIVCLITNSHPSESIRIVYLDVIPYYVRIYLHTLSIKINDVVTKPEKLIFTPGYYRDNPASIEFVLTIPPKSTVSVSIEFEKVFLDWMQYKPDANHGFYLGSSVVSAYFPVSDDNIAIPEQCAALSHTNSCKLGKSKSGKIFQRIFSEPLLIRVPLPDFSMPYNVLCLTCTVIAIGFGSIYNLSTKTFHIEAEREKKSLKEVLSKLKEVLLCKFTSDKNR